MIFGSVCSGIEAASMAWNPLGWSAAFVAEIERFPSEVLMVRHPLVPNRGDILKFKEWPDATIDVLVGGTPCQSFSVAGLRKGLDDPRGNLLFAYLAIAARYRPEWLVWENVPGVLSSNKGRDFGAFLGGLGELGYGFAYRVLDAQYFNLAQRRERVFVVGCLGGWRRAAAVLFERASLRGDSAPSRQTQKNVAASRTSGSHPGSNAPGRRREDDINLAVTHDVAPAIGASARGFSRAGETRGQDQNGLGVTFDGPMYTLDDGSQHAVAFAQNQRDEVREMAVAGALAKESGMKQQTYVAQPVAVDIRNAVEGDVAHTVQSAGIGTDRGTCIDAIPHMRSLMAVRRLTPRECERLQGFPDDYTLIQRGAKWAADGPRYKALGNSMAVPVMQWIGKRIQLVAGSKP